MTRALLDTFWVATYEVGEALRTRLFQLVILAYLGGIGFATWLFTVILLETERNLAEAMGVPATEKPGAMLPQLLANGDLRELLAPAVGGDAAADALLSQPAIGLWVGIAAMGLLPLVLVFTASGTVSTEIRSRSIRYLLVRTGRLEIAAGKLLGQAMLGTCAVALGAGLAWVLGMTLMTGNAPLALAETLVVRSFWAGVYSVPYLALAVGVSQWVANPNAARVLAGLGFVALPIVGEILGEYAGPDFIGRVCDLLSLAIPSRYWLEFWDADLSVRWVATFRSLLFAIVYFAIGFSRFSRRDL